MSRIDEGLRKDEMPKSRFTVMLRGWSAGEYPADCHQLFDGALPKEINTMPFRVFCGLYGSLAIDSFVSRFFYVWRL